MIGILTKIMNPYYLGMFERENYGIKKNYLQKFSSLSVQLNFRSKLLQVDHEEYGQHRCFLPRSPHLSWDSPMQRWFGQKERDLIFNVRPLVQSHGLNHFCEYPIVSVWSAPATSMARFGLSDFPFFFLQKMVGVD